VARKVEEVVAIIREAFSGVERPKKEDLLHFPDKSDDMWIESFLDDTETDWVDIDPKKIEYECEALTAFSPAAWRYYLPAYMTWHLRNYATSGSLTVDNVIYALDFVRHPNTIRFVALSKEQGKAVLAFLEFMSEVSDEQVDSKVARHAIDAYWNKFEE
jgi:hypothetical protein